MDQTVIYVYAIGRGLEGAMSSRLEAVDGSSNVAVASAGDLDAVYSEVNAAAFSQEEIDRRSQDLHWLGSIGYRHERIVAGLAGAATIIPLRAFTLFSSRATLEAYLHENAEALSLLLDRLEGKEEWTLRIELEAEKWEQATIRRVDALRELSEQISQTTPGKGYLLKKKLEEQKRSAAREAELGLVTEIEAELSTRLGAPSVTESRQKKAGSFPQINLLLRRDQRDELELLHQELSRRYRDDGVSLVCTGPWPPYTFATGASDG
jgi:hypothetical protein